MKYVGPITDPKDIANKEYVDNAVITPLEDQFNLWETDLGTYRAVGNLWCWYTSSNHNSLPDGTIFQITALGSNSSKVIMIPFQAPSDDGELCGVNYVWSRSSTEGDVSAYVMPNAPSSSYKIDQIITESVLRPILEHIDEVLPQSVNYTSIHLYTVPPGFYKIINQDIDVYYDGTHYITVPEGTYVQVYQEGGINSFFMMSRVDDGTNEYSANVFVWQDTEDFAHGGVHIWRVQDPGDMVAGISVSNLEQQSNRVTTVNMQSTNDKYPTALAVWNVVSTRELSSNKVTSISDQSSDIEYPSAKCTYDAIQDALYVDTGEVIIPTTKIVVNNTEGTMGADERMYYSLPPLGLVVGDSWHAVVYDMSSGTVLVEADITVTAGTGIYEGYNVMAMDNSVFVDMAEFNYGELPISVSPSSRSGFAWSVRLDIPLTAVVTKN